MLVCDANLKLCCENSNFCKKISQLFYKNGGLRVVISTANLIDNDWRDMENVSAILFLAFMPHPNF